MQMSSSTIKLYWLCITNNKTSTFIWHTSHFSILPCTGRLHNILHNMTALTCECRPQALWRHTPIHTSWSLWSQRSPGSWPSHVCLCTGQTCACMCTTSIDIYVRILYLNSNIYCICPYRGWVRVVAGTGVEASSQLMHAVSSGSLNPKALACLHNRGNSIGWRVAVMFQFVCLSLFGLFARSRVSLLPDR